MEKIVYKGYVIEEYFNDAIHRIKIHTEIEYKAKYIEKTTGQKDLFQ
jgi:hypothetical protein